jgi:hypothetical protein
VAIASVELGPQIYLEKLWGNPISIQQALVQLPGARLIGRDAIDKHI